MSSSESKKKYIKWAILAVFLYFILLFINLPASGLFKLLSHYGISATHSSGGLWDGKAENLTFKNFYLGNIAWQVRPSPILKGKMLVKIDIKRTDGFANAQGTISITGLIEMDKLDVKIPIESLLHDKKSPDNWTGSLNAHFTTLRIKQGWPIYAKGTLDVMDLTGPAQQPINMGSYRFAFPAKRSFGSTLIGDISALEGAQLSVKGQLTLKPNKSYSLDSLVAATTDAPPNIQAALQYLGPADALGRRPLAISGSFQ